MRTDQEKFMGASTEPGFGAFVISLDFELHWGVRDRCPADGPYRENLLGARNAIPRILDLFEEFGIAATWATVGFLFGGSRDEIEAFCPAVRPRYVKTTLDPYREPVGANESEDPLHFGRSLVERIRATPLQEVGTHTFSHYLCLEPGQSEEAFRADLASAVAIAKASGLELRSMVFPRNQFNPAYAGALVDAGIECYRGAGQGWMYCPRARSRESLGVRAARLLDQYVSLSGSNLVQWQSAAARQGLSNVAASMFLRPYAPALACADSRRFARIKRGILDAAEQKQIFHLWWHPHNFGMYTDENLHFLREICRVVRRAREFDGLRSLSMAETARVANGEHSLGLSHRLWTRRHAGMKIAG